MANAPATPLDRVCALWDSRPSLARKILSGYDDYVQRSSTRPSLVVDDLVAATNATDWDKLYAEGKTKFKLMKEMSAGSFEGVVLAHFVRMAKAKTVLEIGMFTGTTTISIALVPSVERVVALELEPYLFEIAEPYFDMAHVRDKIEVHIGDALVLLRTLKTTFDFVFIDANKDGYLAYLKTILDHGLLAEGGCIAVDNTAYKGCPWVADPSNDVYGHAGNDMLEFNKAVRGDSHLEVVMLPIEDGITLIRRVGE